MKNPEFVMAAHRDQIDPGYKFLVHWEAMIVDALVEEVGPTKALDSVRPYYVHAGMALARNALKAFGSKDDILENLITPYNFLLQGHVTPLPFSIKEKCVVGGVRTCLLSYGRPEICIAFTHYASMGICEAIDPDYEIFWTEHLTEGAPFCKFVIKRKDANLKDLENETVIKTIECPELDPELREYIIYDIPAEGGILSTRAFIDACGSERARQVLTARARNWGYQIGPGIAKELGILGNDREGLARLIDYFQRLIKQEGILNVSDRTVEKEVSNCPLSSGPLEHCEQLEAFFDGICASINPDYEFRYDRKMTKGEKSCHWTITKKQGMVKEKTKEQVSSEDPARTLALRYAKGEIAEEELEAKLNTLRRQGLIK